MLMIGEKGIEEGCIKRQLLVSGYNETMNESAITEKMDGVLPWHQQKSIKYIHNNMCSTTRAGVLTKHNIF